MPPFDFYCTLSPPFTGFRIYKWACPKVRRVEGRRSMAPTSGQCALTEAQVLKKPVQNWLAIIKYRNQQITRLGCTVSVNMNYLFEMF